MSGVFQNIDPPPPHRSASVYPPEEGRGGWGVNILEDARHSSVLYICKYFVDVTYRGFDRASIDVGANHTMA